MKKLAIGLVCVVVLLGAGAFALYSNLDFIIKSAVVKYSSLATQTKVGLDSVKLNITSGNGTLSNLSVDNPKGFSSAKAFYLGSIAVTLDTSSIRGTGPIVVSQVLIDKPQVTFELLNNGSTNLQTIQNNVQAYANSFQGAVNATNPAPPSGQPPRKIIISDLLIRGGHVAISQEMLKGKSLGIGLPDIHLTNIGKSSNGATTAQVAQQIFGALTSAAAQSSVAELAKDKLNGVLKAVPASSIGKAAVGNAGSQIKGLFGQ